MTSIVLLRGINVGGHRKVPMAELRDGLEAAGFESVQTYIQSGNVIVDGGSSDRAEIEARVREVLADRFDLDDVSVIAMDRGRMETARDASEREFPRSGGDADQHDRFTHVVFLHSAPSDERRQAIDADTYAPDRFVLDVHDGVGELHVAYDAGAGASKLTLDVIERAFGVRATARNLRTVDRLLAMSDPT